MTQHTLITILWAGFLVGCLDLGAASLNFFLLTKKNPINVLYFIASGLLGKSAFEGGVGIAALGAALHFVIAYSWTALFFLLSSRFSFLATYPILTGIVYGGCIWVVMNIVVLPLSQIGLRPFNPTQALINAGILMVCIGIPLAFIRCAVKPLPLGMGM